MLESLNLSDQNLNAYKYLDLHFKWGCDGSSGHSEYHQKFVETEIERRTVSNESENNYTEIGVNKQSDDGNLFLFSLVPLKLIESTNNSLK